MNPDRDDVFAAIRFCISAEAEDIQGDGGSRRIRDQLQHRAVCEFCEAACGQLPFALTQTNIVGQPGCTPGALTLANGFGCSATAVQNNYAVNRYYRLGHVQVWNLDIQRTLPMGIVLNVGYNGSYGGDLDILRAPNRTADGAAESHRRSRSTMRTRWGIDGSTQLSVNVRKRLQKGVSLQATYHYGHSIDNASSIGGGKPTVAQNDQDLNAEEGNSSFDVRQQVTGNWVLELPFGPNRAYLSRAGSGRRRWMGFRCRAILHLRRAPITRRIMCRRLPRRRREVIIRCVQTGCSLSRSHGAGTILDWFNTAAFVDAGEWIWNGFARID